MILSGEDLRINCLVRKKANQSTLTCSDPSHKQIYKQQFTPATGHTDNHTLVLKHLIVSGEYYCTYQTAQVHWFLRVRGE